MKNSHDPLSKDFESHLTFLFNNIHATTKISFSLFDKEFQLPIRLRRSRRIQDTCTILFFRHTTFELVYLSTYRFRIFSRIRTGF